MNGRNKVMQHRPLKWSRMFCWQALFIVILQTIFSYLGYSSLFDYSENWAVRLPLWFYQTVNVLMMLTLFYNKPLIARKKYKLLLELGCLRSVVVFIYYILYLQHMYSYTLSVAM